MFRNRINLRNFWLVSLIILGAGTTCFGADSQKKSVSPNSPVAIARAKINRGDIESAEEILWGALSSEPDNEPALTLLGIVREKQIRYGEAEALFRRAIQLNSRSLEA